MTQDTIAGAARLTSFLLMLLLTPLLAVAQPPEGRPCENAEARQTWATTQANQLAEKIRMSSDASEKFRRDYVACQEEIWNLNKEYESRTSEKEVTSDSEAEKVLKARFEKRRKFNQIQEKYYKKYSSYLTQRQLLAMYKAERKMMERHFRKEHREQRHGVPSKSGARRTAQPKR